MFANNIQPDVIGLPSPVDLILEKNQSRWLPRLSVAYGLSFEKSELVGFTYPVNMRKVKPHEVWKTKKITTELKPVSRLIKTDAVIAVDLQWLGQIDAIPVVK